MTIEYSDHAKQRMRERGIKRLDVDKAILNPEKVEQIDSHKFICYYKIHKQKLAVVFAKSRESITIITCYYEN